MTIQTMLISRAHVRVELPPKVATIIYKFILKTSSLSTNFAISSKLPCPEFLFASQDQFQRMLWEFKRMLKFVEKISHANAIKLIERVINQTLQVVPAMMLDPSRTS